MEGEETKWKTAFLVLLFIVLAIILAVTTFLLGKNQAPATEKEDSDQSLNIPPQPTAFPTIIPTPTIDEKSEIMQAVYIAADLTEEEADITFNEIRENHAKGLIKEKDAVSGAYWLAARTEEGWVVVYDGQATPECAIVDQYEFPSDLVPECVDEEMELIIR